MRTAFEPPHEPPRWILRMLESFCPPFLAESIEGDIVEEYQAYLARGPVTRASVRKANLRVLVTVIRFFRPGIILRNKLSYSVLSTFMIGNYLKIATRHIAKRKLYSVINAFGLSLAIAFCMLIYLYIKDEKGFDQFQENKYSLYMIYNRGIDRMKLAEADPYPYNHSPYLPARLGEALLDEAPEVRSMTRLNTGGGTMKYGDKVFKQNTSFADSGFFNMFSFPIVAGDRSNPLNGPGDAVLTPAVAEKFFGKEDPIGKSFTFDVNGESTYTVTAVVEAPPANSSIQFEMLLPMISSPYFKLNREEWGSYAYPTFVLLHEGASAGNFGQTLDSVVAKNMGQRLAEWRKQENLPDSMAISEFNAEQFLNIHNNTRIGYNKSTDPMYTWILGGIAVLILFIALINYISLALTTSAGRRIEVGVRKTIGASRQELISQFSIESTLLALISMVFGLMLALAFLPAFNDFTGKDIRITVGQTPEFLLVLLGVTFVVGILAGSYPAFFLSGFVPSKVLKGGFSKVKPGFAKPLVVLQFALSAFLVISSVIMYRQMELITSKDLGFNKEQVIAISTGTGWNERANATVEQFRTRASQIPSISAVAGTSTSFNQGWSQYGYEVDGEHKQAYVYRVDPEYIPLLNIQMAAGRNFDEQIASDSNAIIVNEALVRDMKWKDPLSEHLNWRGDSTSTGAKVVGVVKDFHFLSLNEKIEPMLLSLHPREAGFLTTILVKIAPEDIPGTVEKISKAWKELYPDRPFDYSFVDEDVARQYDQYERWTNIMSFATLFAIIIASLGLFGLAGVNALNKTKEIGIRKVMGAGAGAIFLMLNRQYLILALIAFLIAAPFSYYFMQNWWLNDFQYKTPLSWEIFAISIAGGLLVSLLTVTYHGIKAANINPAETLKCE